MTVIKLTHEQIAEFKSIMKEEYDVEFGTDQAWLCAELLVKYFAELRKSKEYIIEA